MENTARRQPEVDRACKPKAPPAGVKEAAARKPSRQLKTPVYVVFYRCLPILPDFSLPISTSAPVFVNVARVRICMFRSTQKQTKKLFSILSTIPKTTFYPSNHFLIAFCTCLHDFIPNPPYFCIYFV